MPCCCQTSLADLLDTAIDIKEETTWLYTPRLFLGNTRSSRTKVVSIEAALQNKSSKRPENKRTRGTAQYLPECS